MRRIYLLAHLGHRLLDAATRGVDPPQRGTFRLPRGSRRGSFCIVHLDGAGSRAARMVATGGALLAAELAAARTDEIIEYVVLTGVFFIVAQGYMQNEHG
jgi:hypothetical protein